MVRALLATLVAAVVICGCSDGDAVPDNAVEAQEGNVVTLRGLEYRVVLFRELNPRTTPESALVEGRPPEGEGYYAAFLTVCNASGEPRTPTGDIHLEDAFGNAFEPVETTTELAYEPRRLQPQRCEPADGTAADETFSGAALVFSVPFDAVQRRPMVLELRPRGGGAPARVQLDL